MVRKIALGCFGTIALVVIALIVFVHWIGHSKMDADVVYACEDVTRSWHITSYYHVTFNPPKVGEKLKPMCHSTINATDIRWTCSYETHRFTGGIRRDSGKWFETVDGDLYKAGTCKRIL